MTLAKTDFLCLLEFEFESLLSSVVINVVEFIYHSFHKVMRTSKDTGLNMIKQEKNRC